MSNRKIKPLSPDEILEQAANDIPDFVILAVNNLLKKEFKSGIPAVIFQKDIIAEIRKLDLDHNSDEICNNGWLDFESLYSKEGWVVEYDKPGYNEGYEASFTFSRRRVE